MAESSDSWRKHRLLTAVLVADFMVFLGFGVAFLVAPEALLSPLDVELQSAAARLEVRAMYAGLQLGIAGYIGGAFMGYVGRAHVFALSGLSLAGLAVIRSVGLLGLSLHPLLVSLAITEMLGAGLNALALRAALGSGRGGASAEARIRA